MNRKRKVKMKEEKGRRKARNGKGSMCNERKRIKKRKEKKILRKKERKKRKRKICV